VLSAGRWVLRQRRQQGGKSGQRQAAGDTHHHADQDLARAQAMGGVGVGKVGLLGNDLWLRSLQSWQWEWQHGGGMGMLAAAK
jgi:hypothetical protein